MLCIYNGIFHEKSNVFRLYFEHREQNSQKNLLPKVKLEGNKQQQQKLIIID